VARAILRWRGSRERTHQKNFYPRLTATRRMKINLERNLKAQPHRLRCVACLHTFSGDRSRLLLRHQNGSLVGDVCQECFQQGSGHIQQKFKQRAIELCSQPLSEDISPSPHKQALVLWELASEPLVIPPVYYLWWRKLAILAAIQKLEFTRKGATNSRGSGPQISENLFLPEESSIGKDN
jgi:hypothetical protein